MKVVLTGAAGKLGSTVCRALHAAGHDVVATDLRPRADSPVPIHVMNLLDREACYRLIEGAEAVVHLGNHPGVRSGDEQRVYMDNVGMNINTFQAAADLGVKRLIFSSSIQVFSAHPEGGAGIAGAHVPYLPLDSDLPPQPANVYALSKQTGEIMMQYYARRCGLSAVAIRLPFLTASRVEPSKLRHRSSGYSWADEMFTFLLLDDAAALIAAVLRSELPGFRIYFVAAMANLLGVDPQKALRDYYADVPIHGQAESLRSLVDIERVTCETGWTPSC